MKTRKILLIYLIICIIYNTSQSKVKGNGNSSTTTKTTTSTSSSSSTTTTTTASASSATVSATSSSSSGSTSSSSSSSSSYSESSTNLIGKKTTLTMITDVIVEMLYDFFSHYGYVEWEFIEAGYSSMKKNNKTYEQLITSIVKQKKFTIPSKQVTKLLEKIKEEEDKSLETTIEIINHLPENTTKGLNETEIIEIANKSVIERDNNTDLIERIVNATGNNTGDANLTEIIDKAMEDTAKEHYEEALEGCACREGVSEFIIKLRDFRDKLYYKKYGKPYQKKNTQEGAKNGLM